MADRKERDKAAGLKRVSSTGDLDDALVTLHHTQIGSSLGCSENLQCSYKRVSLTEVWGVFKTLLAVIKFTHQSGR